MPISNVTTKLKAMGIKIEDVYPKDAGLLDEIVNMIYVEQCNRMRNYLNYDEGEDIPHSLEHVVEDWTVSRVIGNIRTMKPEYGLYLQSIIEGHVGRKYAPRGGVWSTDPLTALDAVPGDEIARYRRLVRRRD